MSLAITMLVVSGTIIYCIRLSIKRNRKVENLKKENELLKKNNNENENLSSRLDALEKKIMLEAEHNEDELDEYVGSIQHLKQKMLVDIKNIKNPYEQVVTIAVTFLISSDNKKAGENKNDPKKNIKKIFGKWISFKTDFLNKTDLVYFDIYRCVWKADETISV